MFNGVAAVFVGFNWYPTEISAENQSLGKYCISMKKTAEFSVNAEIVLIRCRKVERIT